MYDSIRINNFEYELEDVIEAAHQLAHSPASSMTIRGMANTTMELAFEVRRLRGLLREAGAERAERG